MYSHSTNLVKFVAPKWAESLRCVPEFRIPLGQLNTPIHKWNCPGKPDDVELYIKRDDMTGCTLSGNKVRKLEFIMAEAIRTGCRHVITMGGVQSNFARAVAVASRQLGLMPHLILRSTENDPRRIDCSGNIFLDRILGSKIYLVPRRMRYLEVLSKYEEIAEDIRKETGEKSHLVPIGGSDTTGLYGYLTAFEEMLRQDVAGNFDDIILAVGSGGTAAGLAIANYLTKSNLKIHAVSVSDNAEYFYQHIQETCDDIGLDVSALDLIDIIDGYKGKGYGFTTQEECDFIQDVAIKTGIILDHVYSGKAANGMIQELRSRSHRFKGNRVLFLHTGGTFGSLDGSLNDTLLRYQSETQQISGFDE